MFGNRRVIAWGFAFYVAVLGKLPIGLYAPKYNEKLPKNYPFNPFTRDVLITSVAMTCRGEFSFIIAAFGIGNGLLDPELYSAIIWAVLLACITSPIILTLILRYYNRLAEKYLEQEQLDKSIVGGKGPLYVNIQIRSKNVAGMQDSIKRFVNKMGLFVIDQRSWSPRGLNAIVATELYAVDSKTTVDAKKAVHNVMSAPEKDLELGEETKNEDGDHVDFDLSLEVITSETPIIDDVVVKRCDEIQRHLLSCPELVDAKINVIQWVPLVDAIEKKKGDDLAREAAESLKNKETIDTLVDDMPTFKKARQRMLSGPLSFLQHEKEVKKKAEEIEETIPESTELHEVEGNVGGREGLRRRPRRTRMVSSPATAAGMDMWQEDVVAQEASIAGATPVVQYQMEAGTMRYGARRQRMKSDLGAIAENAPAIEERLSGVVRHTIDNPGSTTPFVDDHRTFSA